MGRFTGHGAASADHQVHGRDQTWSVENILGYNNFRNSRFFGQGALVGGARKEDELNVVGPRQLIQDCVQDNFGLGVVVVGGGSRGPLQDLHSLIAQTQIRRNSGVEVPTAKVEFLLETGVADYLAR